MMMWKDRAASMMQGFMQGKHASVSASVSVCLHESASNLCAGS